MNGYYRPKVKRGEELRPLGLNEIEYVTEDDEPFPRRYLPHGRKHMCPRCHSVTRVIFPDPYCSECGWDSLTAVDWSPPRIGS